MSKKITMTLTVDWEGTDLKQENLDAMKVLNAKFPDYPISHFICPAYYTRGGDPAPITEKIKSVLKPSDEVSLHIHCWYTLMDLFTGRHIEKPTWLFNDSPGTGVKYDGGTKTDYGHDVPLGLFSVEEITKTLIGGRELLRRFGLLRKPDDGTGFRCGGWMACNKVFEALEAAGLEYDASGAPSKFNREVYERFRTRFGVKVPLFEWISLIWGPGFVTSPDFMVNFKSRATYPGGVLGIGDPAISDPAFIGRLVEIPDTGSLADYTTFEDLRGYIDTAVASIQDEAYISMGFHQETATSVSHFAAPSTNIQILTRALEYLQSVTQVEVVTRGAAARRFRERNADLMSSFPDLELLVG